MALLDYFRRRQEPATQLQTAPEAKPPAARRLTTEQAVDALGETLLSMPDPDETLQSLGVPRYALRRMMTDEEIDGAIEVRREAVLSTPWEISGPDDEQAKWISAELEPHMNNLVRAAWGAIPFGYSVIEAVYRKTEDGRYGIARYSEKPMEWFEISRAGSLLYTGRGTNRGEELDTYYKFLVTRNGATYRNPYGEALLSRLYWPWLFRRSSWEFWVQYLERFGQPLLTGKGPDPDALADALAKAARDSVIAVGPSDEVGMHQSTGDGAAFERAEYALVRRMQRRILGQTLTTGTDGSGSRALGEVHERVAETKRLADIRLITETVQQAVNAISWLSFPGKEPPQIQFGDEQGLEADRAERDKALYQAGVRFTPTYFQRAYGLEPDEATVEADDDGGNTGGTALSTGTQAQLQDQGATGGHQHGAQLEDPVDQPFTAGVQALEDMAEELITAVDSPIPPDTLRAEIEAATDIQDLHQRLAALAPENQDGGKFQDQMERAIFAGYILGYEAEEKQLDLDDSD